MPQPTIVARSQRGSGVGPNRADIAAHPAAGTLGSIALMLIWTADFWPVWMGHASGFASMSWQAVFTACYAPLNLWGPALLAAPRSSTRNTP